LVFHEAVTARKIAGLGLAALALLVLAVGERTSPGSTGRDRGS